MISLHASYLIESHSSRSVRAALQITQMSRGQTAGGEMILQPCQPLVHNPLTARRSSMTAFRWLHTPPS